MREEPKPLGELVSHRYGKNGVRILRLDRSAEMHQLFEATVDASLEGAFSEAYTEGDNHRVLPTDSVKNTIYALAREQGFDTLEGFALLLARHFVHSQEPVERSTARIVEKPWSRHHGRPSAFVAEGGVRHMTRVVADTSGAVDMTSGVSGLEILKSADSGFSGFPRDRFTTLEETDDRILATRLEARWHYRRVAGVDFGDTRRRLLQILLDVFADHRSHSMQHTLYRMAEAALAAASEIDRITLRMPNQHYHLAPLEDVGLDNPNHIFVPSDLPSGMIEGTVQRREPS